MLLDETNQKHAQHSNYKNDTSVEKYTTHHHTPLFLIRLTCLGRKFHQRPIIAQYLYRQNRLKHYSTRLVDNVHFAIVHLLIYPVLYKETIHDVFLNELSC